MIVFWFVAAVVQNLSKPVFPAPLPFVLGLGPDRKAEFSFLMFLSKLMIIAATETYRTCDCIRDLWNKLLGTFVSSAG